MTEPARPQIKKLANQGIVGLADLKKWNLVDFWEHVDGAVFEQIVAAMRQHEVKFKDCDPKKENLVGEDFVTGITSIDNLLARYRATAFALMRRITATKLQDNISGIGNKGIQRIKQALATKGILLQD